MATAATAATGISEKQAQQCRAKAVQAAVDKARQLELDMLHRYAGQGLYGELRQICKTLLKIAQRYTPSTPASFADAAAVVKCAKLLRSLDMQPELEAKFAAHVDGDADQTILNSFEYRYLRTKVIAGFATIADLPTKAGALGSVDYQNGVREGYRRASKIALLFLNDIQNGETDGSETCD